MSQVHAAFLTLYNHSSNLLLELKRGDLRIEGALKVKLDAFESAVSQAKNVIPQVNNPAPVEQTAGGPFDGGPVSAGQPAPNASPTQEDIDRELFQQGADMARRDEELPNDAAGALKRGYYSVKPPFDSGEKSEPETAPATPEAPTPA